MLRGQAATNSGCCSWLKDRGVDAKAPDLSKLHSNHSSETHLSPREYAIVQAIVADVTPRTTIKHFEDLFYRSMKFFLPEGSLDAIPASRIPTGVYLAARYSFSQPGRIVQSAFLFYRNAPDEEFVHGYARVTDPRERATKSNVFRFKELQKVENVPGGGFQVFIGGFVYYCRGSFYAIGAAIETDLGVKEREIRNSDIRSIRPVWYILDDDNDIEVIRGIKSTSLRNVGDPASAVIEMHRIAGYETDDWTDLASDLPVPLGVFDPDQLEGDVERLKPTISPEFKMLRVTREE